MSSIQSAYDHTFGIGHNRDAVELMMCYPDDRDEVCWACGEAPWDCECERCCENKQSLEERHG